MVNKPLIHIDTLVRDAHERGAEGTLSHIWPNIRSAAFIVLIVSVPSAIIYGLLFAIAIQAGVDPTVLVRDPATISNVPFYFGLISNLGVLIWAVAASVSAFADISQMDSNAFINALYWDGTTCTTTR